MRHTRITLACLLAAAATSQAQVKITGSVKSPLTISPPVVASMARSYEKIRLAAPDGQYRATVEASGSSLWALLDQAGVEKKTPDGFNRPIDLLVVVKGRHGHEAVFSIGELQMGLQGGRVLLADRLRLLIPHHHEEIPPLAEPDGWLEVGARAALTVPEGCASCHAEKKVPAVDVPRGVCLVAAGDPWPPRFVEDVVEVSVRQLGVTVPAHMKKGAVPGSTVALVRLDGSTVTLHPAALTALGQASFADATFGMGRGFHGHHTWSGVPLVRIVAANLPAATNLDRLWVLVTAADGYRTVLSGKELFAGTHDALLAANEDNQPLWERGPMRLVVPADFYVDRSVHSVQEIRLGTI
ncbi:MAG: molybdopterin-dependent oxidoreductase [Thermoanaerobaculaceae bacterium]|nr:molybdopterin-dependent oxidoreductase [Thermoanaerobaculaceae bacterium]MDI9620723.1 molybdopterin-dependent oxidoreductase [Acidobacteriota bacterium]NLH10531.1 molybdopterin-dependent oxidoreductase [Holophagae bacterium]HPW55834.1 molybdopterin-dependent oxidoreductase [Thermoanaerobaculaceae bacterium]